MPKGEIEEALSPAQWREISSWEYEAYLVIDATVNFDGHIHITKFRESFPSTSWNQAADVLLKDAIIRPTIVGSHTVPRAEAYIVFFKSVKDGRLALVYAREVGSVVPRGQVEADSARGFHQSGTPRGESTRYFNILALSKEEPNQALKPTPMSVTPPAAEESRRQ